MVLLIETLVAQKGSTGSLEVLRATVEVEEVEEVVVISITSRHRTGGVGATVAQTTIIIDAELIIT